MIKSARFMMRLAWTATSSSSMEVQEAPSEVLALTPSASPSGLSLQEVPKMRARGLETSTTYSKSLSNSSRWEGSRENAAHNSVGLVMQAKQKERM
jgi:hypothetical protein